MGKIKTFPLIKGDFEPMNKIFLILLGLLITTPSHLNNSDKICTQIDKLGYYIYNNSNNSWDASHHIASAIISAGGDTRTLAAIAKVESDFTPHVVGDSGSSLYMFQIQPKHHGYVPKNIYAQANKAVRILKDVRKISRYNGSGKAAKVYEAKVLRIRSIIKV